MSKWMTDCRVYSAGGLKEMSPPILSSSFS